MPACKPPKIKALAIAAFFVLEIYAVSEARSFDDRGPTFWDDAVHTEVPPENLTDRFISVSHVTGKLVWRLQPGDYQMPPHVALINVSATLALVGAGPNVTFVHWNGAQRPLVLLEGSSIALESLTATGSTLGRYEAATTRDTLPENLPGSYHIDIEQWAATDDLLQKDYDATALKSGLAAQTLVFTKGNNASVEYFDDHIYFPNQVYQLRAELTALGLGSMNIFYTNSTVRAYTPGHDMERLYDSLVARNGPSVDCYNADLEDNGFTYRGSVSVTATGEKCLSWDDPTVTNNPYVPNLPGLFSSTEGNYCRNPRFLAFGPWCFVASAKRVGKCDIPKCSGTGLTPPPPGAPDGGSSGNHGLVIGLAVGGTVLVMLICTAVSLFLLHRWWQKRRPVNDKAVLLLTPEQPWHPKTYFQTTRRYPPSSSVPMVATDTEMSSLSADERGRPALYSGWSSQVCKEAHEMLEAKIAIDSLDAPDMQYKYGRQWLEDNAIDTSTLIGLGGHGKVYAGSHRGAPAAFKVINLLKTLRAMERFVRKSVMPEVKVQQLPSFPTSNPHLLHVLDCIMFPPWYSLLSLKLEQEADVHSFENGDPQSPDLHAMEAPSSQEGAQSGYWVTAPGRVAEGASNPAAVALMMPAGVGADPAAEKKTAESTGHTESGGGDGIGHMALAVGTSALQSSAVSSKDGRDAKDGKNKRSWPAMFSFESANSVEDVQRTTGGLDTRDIMTQVIFILPLCEMGTLTALLHGESKIPLDALPACLQGPMSAVVSANATARPPAKEGVAKSSDCAPVLSHASQGVTLDMLPDTWQMVLKLQLCLQIVKGVEALHAISLVHCDLKLENVFLKVDLSFKPFGLCAKVGDLDTCRSLRGAHLDVPFGDHLSPLPVESFDQDSSNNTNSFETAASVSASKYSPVTHTHYTSCMKGTPGYLAPEMITQGRVARETDIFSLAVTLSIFLSKHAMFRKTDSLHLKLLPDFPAAMHPQLVQTLLASVNSDPKLRPSLSALKEALHLEMDRIRPLVPELSWTG